MTLDIFARACLFHVFLKRGNTINTNFKNHFQIFVAFCCIANTITFSNMHVRFIVLNLGNPDRFWIGDILSPSCCHAVLQPFDFLNRRMFVLHIRQNICVSCRSFGGISHTRSRNIAVFRNIVNILVTRGHAISTLAIRFRQILRVRSNKGTCENFRKLCGQIQNFVLVKMVYGMIWFVKLKYAFQIDNMLAGKNERCKAIPDVASYTISI